MAFPTTSLIDDFTRANETPLSEAGAWESPAFTGDGTPNLTSNQLDFTSGSWKSIYRDNASYGPDCEVYFTHRETSNAWTAVEPLLRVSNPASGTMSGYLMDIAEVSGTATWSIWRITDNLQTQVGASATGVAYANGDQYGFEAIGSAIKGYRKPSAGSWTQIISVTDSSHSGSGRIGLAANDYLCDNFSGGTVSAGGTPQLLAASIAGVSVVSASLRTGKPLAASITGTSSVSANLRDSKPLAASIQGTSTVAAALSTAGAKLLAASIAGQSAISASLATPKRLAATVTGTSSVSGALRASKRLGASISSTSTVTASLRATKTLAASIASTSAVTAAVRVGKPLAASIASTSSIVARLTVTTGAAVTGRVYQSLQMIRTRIGW